MQLTPDNYYDVETDWQYLSPTVFKRYLACEAEAFAEMNDDWNPDKDLTPLLVGNYLHSYFESEESHKKFIGDHIDELLAKSGKNKGSLKKNYLVADQMIETLSNDPKFQELYVGDKEAIVTGTIDGIPWKGKVDCLNLERGYFVDLKTTQDNVKTLYKVRTEIRAALRSLLKVMDFVRTFIAMKCACL